MEYTRDDVIIWADDERLKDAVGKECYASNNPHVALSEAIKEVCLKTLTRIDAFSPWFPFYCGEGESLGCIILKKEPEKKYIPFDLSKKEDRDELRGKWIVDKTSVHNIEYMIDRFEDGFFTVYVDEEYKTYGLSGEDLLAGYVFADTGKPVGKEVEV